MGITFKNIRKSALIGPACRERFLPLKQPSAAPLRDLDVTLAGISDLAGAYRMGRPRPEFHLLLYTLSGRGRLTRPEGVSYLTRGALFAAPAGRPYAYELAARTWQILWFHFADTPAVRALFAGRAGARRGPPPDLLRHAVEGFLREAGGGEPEAVRAAQDYADLAAVGLKRELGVDPDPRAREVRRRLETLWAEVGGQLHRPWSVHELARLFHASPGHLNRLVTRFQGAKPMQVVTRLRMERARQLLRNGDYAIKQVAAWVGYGNPFAFSVAFKRQVGRSPKAFRLLG